MPNIICRVGQLPRDQRVMNGTPPLTKRHQLLQDDTVDPSSTRSPAKVPGKLVSPNTSSVDESALIAI